VTSDPIPIDRKRRREAETLRALLPDLPQNVPALDDDAAWEERDEAVRQRMSSSSERDRVRAIDKRATALRARQWPAVPVEDAVRLEEGDGAMLRRVGKFLRGDGGGAHDGRARRLLVISSGVGSGKTTAACWWALHRDDSRPVFLRAAAIAACSRYDAKFRRSWEDASSLVIDDLGREFADGKGSLLSDLEEIVDHCYSNGIPLVMTTNLQPACWEDAQKVRHDGFWDRYGGDGPIRSRLRGAGAWFSSSEPDRRKP
jgi:hypothetical protein